MDSRTESILRQLSEIQKMYSAARSVQVEEASKNIKDNSNLVIELYKNIIQHLEKISSQILEKDFDPNQYQLIQALINHFFGCSYHHLHQTTEVINAFKQANAFFKMLTKTVALDAAYLSYYAETCLIQGINEMSLGSDTRLSYYKDAKVSLFDAVKLWQKLHKIHQTGAASRLALAQLSLGQVLTWLGRSKEEAVEASVALQEAFSLLESKEDNVSSTVVQKRKFDLMMVRHHLGINFLRLAKYSDAINHLRELHAYAEEQNNKDLEADAKLGLALCRGLESGFSDETVLSDLGTIYQYYMYTKENIMLRSKYRGVAKLWLQDLALPAEKDQPQQLQWVVSLAQGAEKLSEEVVHDDTLAFVC